MFVPFTTKDGKTFVMQVSEDCGCNVQVDESDHLGLTLREFVDWPNPIVLNQKQVSKKCDTYAVMI